MAVAGVANAAYNGTWTVLTTPSTMQYTATITAGGPAAVWRTATRTTCSRPRGMPGVTPNQSPLRGGSANTAVNGLTCKPSFTLADNTFFFPNVGLHCCRD